jgi:hypothetical protein
MPHETERFLTPELRAYFVPEHRELPSAEHTAVDYNLQRLYGSEFIDELRGESFGGNAGFEFINESESVSCAAVNGYAEPDSGRIITFGNVQYLDAEVIEGKSHVSFKVGMSRQTFQIRILGFTAEESLSDEAKAVLGGTIEAYNFDSEMMAKEERQRLTEIYGELGMHALTGGKPQMSPVRRYTTNRLKRIFRR